MKKFIKNNIIGFVLAVIITLSIGVYAAVQVYGVNVFYDASSSGMNSANMQDAIDELYAKYQALYREKTVLYDVVKSQSLGSDSSINFNQTSQESGTNGVYETNKTDSGKTVYYYRGSVDNNVIFGGYCWKIIRTTETAGCHGVIIPKRRTVTVNSTVSKVSAGATAYVKVARVNNLNETIRMLKENVDLLVKIPMNGKITSLNASVSAGIVIYEAVKQRI